MAWKASTPRPGHCAGLRQMQCSAARSSSCSAAATGDAPCPGRSAGPLWTSLCLPSSSSHAPMIKCLWQTLRMDSWPQHSRQQRRCSTSVVVSSAAAGGPPAGVGTTPKSTQQPQAVASKGYSPLHHNITEFMLRVAPTEDEIKYRHQVVEIVRQQAKKAMEDFSKRCDVQIFGSFATGLSTWSSDVDLVVTGVMEPDRHSGGYDISDRGRVSGRLRRIGEGVRQCKKLDNPRMSLIPKARIPILQLHVRNVSLDISISDDSGARVARYMAQQVRAFPPMRPLVLVLKTYLRAKGLNEVVNGGLSSYSLCNMVIAHLQEELKAGRDIFDLGEVLYAFLLRYGEEFDYGSEAVSVAGGGVVSKQALGFAQDGGRGDFDRHMDRLSVDCPLSGRDVSNGSFRIQDVRTAFQRGARNLEAMARGRRISDVSLNYLSALFDPSKMVRRQGGSEFNYEDDYIRVLGKGQGTGRSESLTGGPASELDEEELLSDIDLPDSWENSSAESSSDSSSSPRGRGGPRGKGTRQQQQH